MLCDGEKQSPRQRLALWCASTLEFRAAMLERAPQTYFVPPYVGHRG